MSDTEDLPSFGVEGQKESPTKTTVTVRDFELVVDEPENLGGTDDGPNPLEYLLAAQAGCLNATAHEVADDMDIELNAVEIEGDVNPAKFQGQSSDPQAGYQDVRVTIEADTDVDDETRYQWAEQTEERCPVTDNMQDATPMDISVTELHDDSACSLHLNESKRRYKRTPERGDSVYSDMDLRSYLCILSIEM